MTWPLCCPDVRWPAAGTGPVPVPVCCVSVLAYCEADLLCQAGHVTVLPATCADGRAPRPRPGAGPGTGAEVAAVKDHARLPAAPDALTTLPPLQVEDGWLLDGQHRLARALATGAATLTVIAVHGILAQQRGHHDTLLSHFAGVHHT